MEFEKAKEIRQKILYKWIIRHAKQIYGELYLAQVVTHESGKKTYLNFMFLAR